MEFNWINLFGGIVVVIMLIPNVIYALKRECKVFCVNPLD